MNKSIYKYIYSRIYKRIHIHIKCINAYVNTSIKITLTFITNTSIYLIPIKFEPTSEGIV